MFCLKLTATDGPTPSTVTGDYDNHLELLLRDKERLEEEVRGLRGKLEGTVTQGSLMERLEAQQRRITSLELADKVQYCLNIFVY